MSVIKKLYHVITNITNRITKDNVGLYSAQASYFIILSIFPLVMFIFTIIGSTSLPQDTLFSAVKEFLPSSLDPFIEQIISDIYAKKTGTVLSLTSITALWAASKGVYALTTGMYQVYHVPDKRNYFISRFFSIIYTVIFVAVIIFTLAIMVFGNKLYVLLAKKVPILYDIVNAVFGNRTLITLCILTLFFLLMFKTVHKSGYSIGQLLPGAIFSSIGWMVFSFLFSLYVDNINNFTNTYGSLTTIVILMLWLYVCMFILFLGGEINVWFKEFFPAFKQMRQDTEEQPK